MDPAVLRALRSLPVERDFPWRATRDPWRILVAEVCCQQTQAVRAVGVYERCVASFPTPRACSDAPLAELLAAFAGLGYYRRAVALHRAATRIVDVHGGLVPDRYDELLALPGIGPYTARAVLAFAYDRDVGVLDTNVARVLARAVAGRALSRSEAQHIADAIVGPGRGWAHNQALLDLGAAHCRATPRCEGCALAAVCRYRRGGMTDDPARGSAGVSRAQAGFAGSDRQGRGRLLATARRGGVRLHDVAAAAGWPDDPARARRVCADLVHDGLLERRGGAFVLAGSVRSRRSAPPRGRRGHLAGVALPLRVGRS